MRVCAGVWACRGHWVDGQGVWLVRARVGVVGLWVDFFGLELDFWLAFGFLAHSGLVGLRGRGVHVCVCLRM